MVFYGYLMAQDGPAERGDTSLLAEAVALGAVCAVGFSQCVYTGWYGQGYEPPMQEAWADAFRQALYRGRNDPEGNPDGVPVSVETALDYAAEQTAGCLNDDECNTDSAIAAGDGGVFIVPAR